MHPERRVFWMTMFSSTTPEASPKLGFTPLELKLLDAAVSDKILRRWSFADYLNKLACLGGYPGDAGFPRRADAGKFLSEVKTKLREQVLGRVGGPGG
jgi:hypothetical protein